MAVLTEPPTGLSAGASEVMQTKEELIASLTEKEMDMSVEEYLKAQCARRVEGLKRHMSSLVEEFSAEAKRARQRLEEVSSSTARAAADVDGEFEVAQDTPDGQALVDPFALVGIRGFHAGRVIQIQPTADKTVWSIGRVENNDVSLMGDDEVSSNHAQICFERNQFKLKDLGSTNGTFATNGKGSTFKLAKKKNHILKVDHLVTFGGTTFKWCYLNDANALVQVIGGI